METSKKLIESLLTFFFETTEGRNVLDTAYWNKLESNLSYVYTQTTIYNHVTTLYTLIVESKLDIVVHVEHTSFASYVRSGQRVAHLLNGTISIVKNLDVSFKNLPTEVLNNIGSLVANHKTFFNSYTIHNGHINCSDCRHLYLYTNIPRLPCFMWMAAKLMVDNYIVNYEDQRYLQTEPLIHKTVAAVSNQQINESIYDWLYSHDYINLYFTEKLLNKSI